MIEPSPAQGTLGDRYELREIIGRGGMGLVYRAHDRQVGRDVALKTLIDIPGKGELKQFYKERQVLASLLHPNLVEVFDFGEFQDYGVVKPFFVMPLLSGMTLAQLLRSSQPAPGIDRLAGIFQQICLGLEAIHAIGFVHRDIKPSNIFVMDRDCVKVIDFGIAHLVGANTVTGLKGTPAYMSPEQIRGEECTAASDIFSLGVLCYEALTGAHPFRGGSTEEILQATLYRVPQPVYELNTSVCPALARVVHKALAKHPAHRISSAAEFARWLQMAVRGETPAVIETPRIQPRIERAQRAFDVGDIPMANDILSDLENSGHIDSGLVELRRRLDEARRSNTIGGLLDRARLQLAEDECALALQTIESVFKIDASNHGAVELKTAIRQRITNRAVEDCLRSAQVKIEQGAFTEARDCLQKAHGLKPADQRANDMLLEIDLKEQAHVASEREKDEWYHRGLEAWKDGEFQAAAKELKRVVELAAADGVEKMAHYSAWLERAQSAVAAVADFEAQAMRYIAEGNYDRALSICSEFAERFPGHPLIAGMRLAIEARRRQETLDRASQIASRAAAEPDLAARVSILLMGCESLPDIQSVMEPWVAALRSQHDVVDELASRARTHEEHERYPQALDCWQMVRTVHPQFAGVDREIERLESDPTDTGKSAPPDRGFHIGSAVRRAAQESQSRAAAVLAWLPRAGAALLAARPRFERLWTPQKARMLAVLLGILLVGRSEMPPARSVSQRLRTQSVAAGLDGRSTLSAVARRVPAESAPSTTADREIVSPPSEDPSGPSNLHHDSSGPSAVSGGAADSAAALPQPADASSNRNSGALLVSTGLEAFQVFLDGQPIRSAIRNGAMLIPNLAVRRYRLRVTADGHEAAEQEIAVVRAGTVRQTVTLSEAPGLATLAIRDAPPRSQVLIDGDVVGATGVDGAMTYERVRPGVHRVELHNNPEYQSKTFLRTFKAADTIALAGEWTRLERFPSAVTINVTPPNARLWWQCGQNPPQGREGAVTVECTEERFSATVELEGYETASKTWPLAPGEHREFSVVLSRAAVSHTGSTGCSSADLIRSGWKLDGEWLVPTRSLRIPCSGLTGQFEFTIQVPRGVWPKPVEWALNNRNSSALTVQLDKKSITVANRGRKEISEYCDDGTLKFRILIEPASVTEYLWVHDSWMPIGTATEDLRKSELVFTRNVRLKDFTFLEK